jgi:hypothetical protein
LVFVECKGMTEYPLSEGANRTKRWSIEVELGGADRGPDVGVS